MPHFFGGRCTASNFQTEWNWKVSKGKNTLSPYLSLSTLSLTKTTTYLSLSLSLSLQQLDRLFICTCVSERSSDVPAVRRHLGARRSAPSAWTASARSMDDIDTSKNCFGVNNYGKCKRQQLLPEEDREPLQPPLTNNLQGTFMHLSMVHTGAVSFSIWGKQKYFKSNGMR